MSNRLQSQTKSPSSAAELRGLGFWPMVIGGGAVAILAIVLNWSGFQRSSQGELPCATAPQPSSPLTHEQLARFLVIPERSSKEVVRSIVQTPYCNLLGVEVRAGETAEREAYLLKFDSQNWLVILYEGEEYAGFRISNR